MPQLTLPFVTLDVFTTTRYEGNPLAIVSVPPKLRSILSNEQKQAIAREFNLSETVFLYLPESDDEAVKISIYTIDMELPFAGHPTVGTTCYWLGMRSGPKSSNNPANEGVLNTLSGKTPIAYDHTISLASVNVSHDVLIHKPYTDVAHISHLLGTAEGDILTGPNGGIALSSIVKGLTFLLVQLSSLSALGKISKPSEAFTLSATTDSGRASEGPWLSHGFVGIYAFVLLSDEMKDGVKKLRTRMITDQMEDPATGSAASALAAWMSLTSVEELQRYEITQGVEMGRRSEITVTVTKDEKGIKSVNLQGKAVKVMEGTLEI